MKLYIKQKVFSLTDRYDVYDELGNLVYDVDSEFFTWTAKLHLMDVSGNELYFIQKKWTFLLASYEIFQNDRLVASVMQEFSFFKPRLTVECSIGRFDISGDFFEMDFSIRIGDTFVGSVSKKWLSWSDSYELEAGPGIDPAFFAALVITIDHCFHNEQNRS